MATFAPFPFSFKERGGVRIDLDSFEEFAKIASEHSNKHGMSWRGQADAKWSVTSSAFNAEKKRMGLYSEAFGEDDLTDSLLQISDAVHTWLEIISRNVQKAIGTDPHLRLLFREELVTNAIDTDAASYNELLSIGQHFGMKTPLIDMTDSAYVALYFAAFDALRRERSWRLENRFAVWKVPTHLWNPKLDYVMIPGLEAGELAKRQAEFEGVSAEKLPSGYTRVTVCNVFPKVFRNDRLVAQQQGSFVRITPDLPLDHVVSMMYSKPRVDEIDSMNRRMIQYTLPAGLALDCLIHLSKMNIRHETLFPDMMGQMEAINLAADHYDYGGVGNRWLFRRSMFDANGHRREDFFV